METKRISPGSTQQGYGKMYWQHHIDVCFVPSRITADYACTLMNILHWVSSLNKIRSYFIDPQGGNLGITTNALEWYLYITGQNEHSLQDNAATLLSLLLWLQSQSCPITSCHAKELTSNLQQCQLSGSCREPVNAGRSCPPGDLEATGQLLEAKFDP